MIFTTVTRKHNSIKESVKGIHYDTQHQNNTPPPQKKKKKKKNSPVACDAV